METFSWWNEALEFVRRNETLIEVIVFALGFCESLFFVSFFVPASALFIAIAALEGAAGGPLLPMLLAGSLGCFAGDMVSFAMGDRYKHDLPERWPFKTNPGWLPGAQSLFERWGMSAVVVSKFIGPLRPVIPVVAGASHMPWPTFAAASSVPSVIWSTAFLAPPYYGLQLLTS